MEFIDYVVVVMFIDSRRLLVIDIIGYSRMVR